MEWQPRNLPFQNVSIEANDNEPAEDKARWKPYGLGTEKIIATTVKGRVNAAGVGALSRRLMAIERGRALGRKPLDLRAYTLEQAARRWAEERAKRK